MDTLKEALRLRRRRITATNNLLLSRMAPTSSRLPNSTIHHHNNTTDLVSRQGANQCPAGMMAWTNADREDGSPPTSKFRLLQTW